MLFTPAVIVCLSVGLADSPADVQPLPGTKPLTMEGDITSQLVDGVDKFLLREIEKSVDGRSKHWNRDLSSPEAYNKSIEPNRKRLAHILGVRDARVNFDAHDSDSMTDHPLTAPHKDGYEIYTVRWPAFGDVYAEGLLLDGTQGKRRNIGVDVVAIPDADQTPEQIAGLVEGVPLESQFARRLAESGCRVLVPVLIDRTLEKRNGRANLTSREFLYRSAFELGRHLIGYEVQKVLAGVDWFSGQSGGKMKIGVIGYGEGGAIALYAAALDTRIQAACVSGYFDDRRGVWQQPIDRNVFGLLEQFGDAELAAMIVPRAIVIEAAKGPELELPSQGGAPAHLTTPKLDVVREEFERAHKLVENLRPRPRAELVVSGDGTGPFGTPEALSKFLDSLSSGAKLATDDGVPQLSRKLANSAARQNRQIHEVDRHNQKLLIDSPYIRQDFMSKLDTSSLEKYQQTVEPYREIFRNEVVGRLDQKSLAANPRTRKVYDEEKWTGYEVVLDVFPDVIAYGVLLVPKDLKLDGSEKRPVVVCQHGLEGRPRDTIQTDLDGFKYYSAFSAKLAERGFITFAPQNLYIFTDRFRSLQRKANPLGKTLFSIIVPQHQQITDWLKSLPYVDPERIGFYGLSYGGKSAMRIPPLVSNYCLSICSADFNEWVWKNASSHPRNNYTYVWTGEYEIFEFDLGSTFNYAEMAALIAPRPFMVERGHFDGVAPDETVAYEFAKVFHLYNARLHIGDRCELEWFTGPHMIHGEGTFEFLHKHLKWPKPE